MFFKAGADSQYFLCHSKLAQVSRPVTVRYLSSPATKSSAIFMPWVSPVVIRIQPISGLVMERQNPAHFYLTMIDIGIPNGTKTLTYSFIISKGNPLFLHFHLSRYFNICVKSNRCRSILYGPVWTVFPPPKISPLIEKHHFFIFNYFFKIFLT